MEKKSQTRRPSGPPRGRQDKMVTAVSYVVMTVLGLVCLLPCLHVASKAVSNNVAVTLGKVYFWPNGFQLDSLRYVLTETGYVNALKNSIVVTVIGVAGSMLITILFAYPLSEPQLRGRGVLTILCMIAMVFSGGLVPTYMVFRTMGFLNTRVALIVPHLLSIFNLLIVRNSFEGLPDGVKESARIDGAGDFQVLFSVVCPMSKPVLATVSMLYAVSYWNNYFDASIYITKDSLKTIQVYLKNVTADINSVADALKSATGAAISSDGMIACAVTLTVIPIIMVYPFVQGITIGSEKG